MSGTLLPISLSFINQNMVGDVVLSPPNLPQTYTIAGASQSNARKLAAAAFDLSDFSSSSNFLGYRIRGSIVRESGSNSLSSTITLAHVAPFSTPNLPLNERIVELPALVGNRVDFDVEVLFAEPRTKSTIGMGSGNSISVMASVGRATNGTWSDTITFSIDEAYLITEESSDPLEILDFNVYEYDYLAAGAEVAVSGGVYPYTYIFNFGEGFSVTTDQPFAFNYYVTSGTYPVFVTAEDSDGMIVESSVRYISVKDYPVDPSSSDVYVEGFHVYELDRGWSFDGAYIPHYAELNWYFGEDPFTDKTIQKVRIHGLSKGRTFLSMAVAGMQVDYDRDFTEPQQIDLPLNAAHISTEFIPTTNYVDSSNWGVSLQLRFEGRNTDLARPEPSHVLQVLALQGSPQGNGARNN